MQDLQPADRIEEDQPEAEAAEAAKEATPGAKPRAKRAPAKGAKAEANSDGSPAQRGREKRARAAKQPTPSGPPPRLKERYRREIAPALQRELALPNVMQVPRVTKVVVNIGLGEALTNPKAIESAERDLGTITGQHPIVTRARKSIAGFKIRAGNPIGLMVTLRGDRMYEFLDRLINVALPRVRDFRGAPNKGFDGRGNYSLGLREHVIFPEIDYNTIDRIRGLQVTIVTTAQDDDSSRQLLALMGVAFSRETAAA